MGRIQSSIGLITGTDIAGTVDQLIALSGRPRDRLISRTHTLQLEQQALAELTASVIGVQLAGNQLSSVSAFRSKTAESSDSTALSTLAGNDASPGSHAIRTLRKAATHAVRSLQRFESADEALGSVGTLSINPAGGFIDGSASLSGLNGGRGVEAGTIRITDRSGSSSDIDLSDARSINDVIDAINDAEIDVRATTVGNAIQLLDQTGDTLSNLKLEQLGSEETAADLGLWGIDTASNTATGIELELPAGEGALRGTLLSELGGGSGIGPLTDLDINLSDGSSAVIDLSSATTTSEVIDAIDSAGLSLIVRLNDARNGLQIRDVSGGNGNLTVTSADDTAADLGIDASTSDDILVGANLSRQTVTTDTLLSELNQGNGIDEGSFTITDSSGAVGAVNLTVEGITSVGELVDAINNLGIGVTASLNDAGDGIAVVDTAGGSSTLAIEDTGTRTTAADLGIAGTATDQTVGGSLVSALVGTQAGVIEIEADDTLETLAAKINADGRYADASVQLNDDGTYSLTVRSNRGGQAGRIAINSTGFNLDLRTDARGQDALIAVSTDGGVERFLTSSDGVFEIDGSGSAQQGITSSTLLDDIASDADRGSFTITDSAGVTSAINITAQQLTTVGQLVDAINDLGIGVTASINESGTGIAVVDTAAGSGTLTISDTGNGTAATSLGIAGEATTQTIDGSSVSALVGPAEVESSEETTGLVVTLKELSDSPITVTVEEDTSAAVSAAQSFVDQYNLLVDKLDSLTFYNADTEEVGLLFGSSEALRIGNGYTRLLSGRIVGAGDLQSIGQVGLRFNDQGKLDLDSDKLTDAIGSSRTDVEEFFTIDQTGLAARLSNLADSIAGASSGMLLNRSETLTSQIEFNNTRIEGMNTRLEKERERLLQQFYATEEAIAKIQSNQTAIQQIQPITIPT
jgi:flagellar hook-associated protein 2